MAVEFLPPLILSLVAVDGDTEHVTTPLLSSIAEFEEEGDAINNEEDAGGDTINKSSSSSSLITSCSITGWSDVDEAVVVALLPLEGGTLFERRRLSG